ncbi:MAG: FHIPEP family type III secretion protein [Vulcanimicrobiota bacterium]
MDVTGGVVALLTLAAILIGSRWTRRERKEKVATKPEGVEAEERCTVRVGRGVLPLADPKRGALLLRVVPILRLRWAERGLTLPAARFTDDAQLGYNEYALMIDGREVLRETVYADRVLVMPPPDAVVTDGVEANLEGVRCWWVARAERQRAEERGWMILEPEEAFLSQLSSLARARLHELEEWGQYFSNPSNTQLERFRERVIQRLDNGLSVHPIDYFANRFERHGELGYENSDPMGIDDSCDMVAAMIFQSLALYLKDAVTRRLNSNQLERLNRALLMIWEFSEDEREQLMRRARFWNLYDDEEAVRSVVHLMSQGREVRSRLRPQRRLALLLSCLEEPSRTRIINRVATQLSDRELGELASELSNIPPCTILTSAALTDPLERERTQVVGEFIDSVEQASEQPVSEFIEEEAIGYVRRDPSRAAVVVRQLWFFDDPIERLRRAAFRTPERIAQMILFCRSRQPGYYLWGPEKIAILLDCLPANLARTLRRALARTALPPQQPGEITSERRQRVLYEFVRRSRALSRQTSNN